MNAATEADLRLLEPRTAARLLRDWGFLAVPDLPDRPGPAYLLVALRAVPTLRHYDPEITRYWATEGGKGVKRSLTRGSAVPIDTAFSWGLVQIEDRLKVTNEYLTFGGQLRAEMVDGDLIAVFASPAPLLRRGGHSQAWDPGAESIGAYFGRVLANIGYAPGFEEEAADAGPVARYAAFLSDALERYRESPVLRVMDPDLWTLLRAEEGRVQSEHRSEWAQGQHLRVGPERSVTIASPRSTGPNARIWRADRPWRRRQPVRSL